MITIYKIRVNYKSGIQEEFWVKEFSIKNDNWKWVSFDIIKSPIYMNVDEIESVWQLESKEVEEEK